MKGHLRSGGTSYLCHGQTDKTTGRRSVPPVSLPVPRLGQVRHGVIYCNPPQLSLFIRGTFRWVSFFALGFIGQNRQNHSEGGTGTRRAMV